MDFIKKNLVGLIAMLIAVIAVLGVHVGGNLGAIAPTDIAATNFTEVTASNGLAVGTSQQFNVSSAGVLTDSAAMTLSGAITQTAASVFSTLTQGGGVTSTTTNGNSVLTYSMFDTENAIAVTINVGASGATVSFPASSTITGIANAGDFRDFEFINSTSTSGVNLTIAGGTGVMLQNAAGGTTTAILPGKTARGTLFRATSTRDLVLQVNTFNY